MGRISLIVLFCFNLVLPSGYLFAESLRNVEALILKDAYAQAAVECNKVLAGRNRASIKSQGYYLLGICHLQEGKFEQARQDFNTVLHRYKGSKFSDDAGLGIADSYFLAGDYRQASTHYEQFLRHYPRSPLISIARAHLEQSKQSTPFANSYFSVQVGCFTNKDNAEKLRDELINAGFQAYVLNLPSENLHRVRVGKFSNRLKAEFLEQQLRGEGYTTKVCP